MSDEKLIADAEDWARWADRLGPKAVATTLRALAAEVARLEQAIVEAVAGCEGEIAGERLEKLSRAVPERSEA